MEEILLGKYKVIKKLGKGSFGQIYKAKDIKNNNFVAVKVDMQKDKNYLKKEALMLNKLTFVTGIP